MIIKLINDDMLKQNIKCDAIITDLPYGETQNKKDIIIPFDKLWKWVKKTEANIFITTAQGQFMIDLINSLPKGWKWYDIIWDKKLTSGFLNAKKRPLRKHENIIVMYKKQTIYNPQFTKGKPLHSKGKSYLTKNHKNENYGKFEMTDDKRAGSTDKYPTSILSIQKPHPSKSLHRTEKPIELMEWLVRTYTNKGQLVCDPTMGVGGTGIACFENGRNFIGIELDKKYFNIARERIKKGKW